MPCLILCRISDLEDVMKPYRPFIFLACFVLIVGLACAALGGGNTPAPQPPTQQQPPTQSPPNPPTAAPQPTQPPVQQTQQFFTEEFDSDPGSNWETAIIGP